MRIGRLALLLALFQAVTATGAIAWEVAEPFQKGDRVVQFGIGLGVNGAEGEMKIPPLFGCVEVAYSDFVSLGGYVEYFKTGYRPIYLFDAGWDYSYIAFGGRGAYHFGFLEKDKIDTYAGLGLGYVVANVSSVGDIEGYSASGSFFQASGFGGIRYWRTPAQSFFAELGFGYANLVVGVAFKI